MCGCFLLLSLHLFHHLFCCVGSDGAGGDFIGFAETRCLATSSSHRPQLLIFLFQGLRVCRHGVIILREGSGCGSTWDIFEGGAIFFSWRGGGFISCAFCRPFRRFSDHSVLFHEVFYCCGPAYVSTLLPFFHHRLFEDIGFINACDELRHFIVVSDLDGVLRGVVLPPCEVLRIGADMLVGGVAPVGNKSCLRCHPFCRL